MEMGCCLDPEGNRLLPGPSGKWGQIRGRGGAGPGPPERGKDRQLKPSKGRDNMKEDEEEQPLQA